MIHRCVTCKRLIWPWQRFGFFVQSTVTIYWHARVCQPRPDQRPDANQDAGGIPRGPWDR